jgi:hypothetical protein
MQDLRVYRRLLRDSAASYEANFTAVRYDFQQKIEEWLESSNDGRTAVRLAYRDHYLTGARDGGTNLVSYFVL